MSIRDEIQSTLRARGFWEGGKLTDLSREGGDVNTAGRAFARSGVELAASDSTSLGNEQLFLVGPSTLPAHAGEWPFIV